MPKNLKVLLKPILTKTELEITPTSFDIVGSILIFSDFPDKLVKKEKKIATLILDNFKNIKTVCKKIKNYQGKFRTPKLKIIGGKRTKETIYKENNIQIKLNIEKVYFSSRLAHERDRINKLIKPNEDILVMFSGCGIYPINISKNTSAKHITGIELNPVANKYAAENINLNKSNNITIIHGDVRKILPKIKKKYDRILMPLPKGGGDFLELAINHIKNNGYIHFHDFLHESEFKLASDKIVKTAKILKKSVKILKTNKCGQFGPGKFRICIDAKII